MYFPVRPPPPSLAGQGRNATKRPQQSQGDRKHRITERMWASTLAVILCATGANAFVGAPVQTGACATSRGQSSSQPVRRLRRDRHIIMRVSACRTVLFSWESSMKSARSTPTPSSKVERLSTQGGLDCGVRESGVVLACFSLCVRVGRAIGACTSHLVHFFLRRWPLMFRDSERPRGMKAVDAKTHQKDGLQIRTTLISRDGTSDAIGCHVFVEWSA